MSGNNKEELETTCTVEQVKVVFFVVLFKLTTCFGLCFRPSSDHKIYIIGGCYTKISHKIRYMGFYYLHCIECSNDIYLLT